MKKLTSVLLLVILVFQMFGINAFASSANNDDLLFAYAQLLNTVVMWSNDQKATHYQLFDENEDGIPEIVTYNTGSPYGAAFASWSYSNGSVHLDFCSGKYYYYYSLCIGDQKEVYHNGSISRTYQNIEVLIDNYNVVGGIEIGSSEDVISNMYRPSLQEKYRRNLEMWGSENSHVLRAYADVLKSGITIWEDKNTPATHYWLYDKNSDGIPELLVFGRDSSVDSLAFREYGYIDGKAEIIAKTAGDSIYYSLAICNGVECCLNEKDYGVYGSVEKLVQNGHIIGGIRIGSSDDYLTKTSVVTTSNSEKAVLAIGDYVKFGNDRTWQVIHLGQNTATLFCQGCFLGVFDASLHMEAHTISLMNYKTYGSATWEYSDVRQWLNAREASDSSLDVAFDYSNLAQGMATVRAASGAYAYAGKPGFLSTENFTDLEYWLLEPTENISFVPYTQIPGPTVVAASSFMDFQADMDKLYSAEIGQTQTIDRIFLLNGREIKEYLIDNNLSPFVFTSGKTYPDYWLRDAVYNNFGNYYHYYGTNILTVANKRASSQQADLEAYIRPACNINLSYVTGISGAGTADDPYILMIDSSVINRPISLVDDTEKDTAQTTTTEPATNSAAFESAFQHTERTVVPLSQTLSIPQSYTALSVLADDGKEYTLRMENTEDGWYVNAEDLATLADVKFSYSEKNQTAGFVRSDASSILYIGECIFVDGEEYVPAIEASIACGVRFCEFDGELHAERLRTPADLRYRLSEKVFGSNNIDISRALVEHPVLMGIGISLSEGYEMLGDGFADAIVGVFKYISGITTQERYDKAMNSLLDYDYDESLAETIKDGSKLLEKLNKYLTYGEDVGEALDKRIEIFFDQINGNEEGWEVFEKVIEKQEDDATFRLLLKEFTDVSKTIKKLGGYDALINITNMFDVQGSVLYTMEDVFAESENKNAAKAVRKIVNLYEMKGIAVADGAISIAKSALFIAMEELYEQGFDTEMSFDKNPQEYLMEMFKTIIYDEILSVDDMTEFMTLMPVYTSIQQDIELYYYDHYDEAQMGDKLRGAGIMYLNAALKYFEMLEFDKEIDLTATKDFIKTELAELLSYEEAEYLPEYSNEDLICFAERCEMEK